VIPFIILGGALRPAGCPEQSALQAHDQPLAGLGPVYAGLTLVHKVGAGTFMPLTVTAALIMSLLSDHYAGFVSTLTRSAPAEFWAAC
jgi:Putative inner membrane exporter, YdcZ